MRRRPSKVNKSAIRRKNSSGRIVGRLFSYSRMIFPAIDQSRFRLRKLIPDPCKNRRPANTLSLSVLSRTGDRPGIIYSHYRRPCPQTATFLIRSGPALRIAGHIIKNLDLFISNPTSELLDFPRQLPTISAQLLHRRCPKSFITTPKPC